MKFALIVARRDELVVHELFAADPQLHSGLNVRSVDDAVQLGWVVGADGSLAPRVPSPEERAREIKAECSRQIFAALSDSTQKNLTAYAVDLALQAADGPLSAEQLADVAAARSARHWVIAMITECRGATTESRAANWPAVPATTAVIAARF